MRKTFSNIIEKISVDDKIIFLTGDLGFNAFENLQEKMKDRFINTGVAEQNMIGMAAGIASKGFKVFCYSITPFITFRCLEQIRIDVCFHKLPVFIVGNGGGYGYGIMGATHHALEDIACMSSLPNMTCYVPSFIEDVGASIDEMMRNDTPAYLRLGLGKNNPGEQEMYKSINTIFLSDDAEVTMVALGPVINNAIHAIENKGLKNKINLFSITRIPIDNFDDGLIQSIVKTGKLLIIEEHVERGGIAESISINLMKRNIQVKQFKSLCALGYPNELYGDQNYHQVQSGMDSENIQKIITDWIN
jgi:transketolase